MPDPEKRETFLRSTLKWDEAGQGEHARMQVWYRDLIRLRRSTHSLNNGEPGNARVTFDETRKWLTLDRGEILTICNLGDGDHQFTLPESSRLLLASNRAITIRDSALTLLPDSVVIIRRPDRSR